jgi:HlyD family secretion protein
MKAAIRAIVLAGIAAAIAFYFWKKHQAAQVLEWAGSIEARTVSIGSRVGGRVKEVLVKEGDAVAANQPLIVLEPGDLPAQRLQAQGNLELAQANLAKVAGKGSGPRQQQIAAARARLAAQQASEDKMRHDLARTTQLVNEKVSTPRELDDAQTSLRNATAQKEALQASLDELLRGTPEDVKGAQGSVDAAKGRLDQIDTLLAELTIRAPAAARVEVLDLRPGDILAPDAPAARLLEASQLYARIYVPETQLGFVKPSQQLDIYVDSFPDKPFRTHVESISEVGEYTPRNLQTEDERADQVFAARLVLDEGRDTLRAGMAAFARLKK